MALIATGLWQYTTLHEATAKNQIPAPPKPPSAGASAQSAGGQNLPFAVEETRQRLLALASTGQYGALESMALHSGARFVFHHGFERAKPAQYWRGQAARGFDPLKRLMALLKTHPARDEQGLYMWPAAAVALSSAALDDLRAFDDANRIQRYATEGYTGWRTGIDDQGRWRLFLKGN